MRPVPGCALPRPAWPVRHAADQPTVCRPSRHWCDRDSPLAHRPRPTGVYATALELPPRGLPLPPDNSAGRWSMRSASPTRAIKSSGTGRSQPHPAGHPPGPDQHILQHGELREQVMFLKDEADVVIAEPGQARFVQCERIFRHPAEPFRSWERPTYRSHATACSCPNRWGQGWPDSHPAITRTRRLARRRAVLRIGKRFRDVLHHQKRSSRNLSRVK